MDQEKEELFHYLKYEETLLTPSRADQVSQAVVRQKTKQSYAYNSQITKKSTKIERLKSKNLAAHLDFDWLLNRKHTKAHLSEYDSLLDN